MVKFYVFQLDNGELGIRTDIPGDTRIFHINDHIVLKIQLSFFNEISQLTGLSEEYANGLEAILVDIDNSIANANANQNMNYQNNSKPKPPSNILLYVLVGNTIEPIKIPSIHIIDIDYDADFINNVQRRITQGASSSSSGFYSMQNINGGGRVNKHQKVFKEILKDFSDEYIYEPMNLYLTYRGIKKGCYMHFHKKRDLTKILAFCKKYKLECLHKKRNMVNIDGKVYKLNDVYISKKKIPKSLVETNHREVYIGARVLGNMLGFPKACIDDFVRKTKYFKKHKKMNKKKRYGHEIIIYFILKNGKIYQYDVYYFVCDKMCFSQMKKMAKMIYDDFNKNLKNLFSYFNISYHIKYLDVLEKGKY